MTEKKVFISKDNTATIVCPKCEKAATVDVSKYKQLRSTVRLRRKCSCGHSHVVILERRRYYRKETRLPGVCISGQDKVRRPVLVRDLSRSGLKLELEDVGDLKIGDRLLVEFNLDNKHHTLIIKEVIIRTIMGNLLGTEFCSRDPNNAYDKAYDMAIGHYTFR